MRDLAELVAVLASEGTAVGAGPDGGLVLTSWHAEPLPEPVPFEVTAAAFAQHLVRTAEHADGIWPDVDPLEAAFRLFLVHLDEEVGRYDAQVVGVGLDAGQLRATPTRAWVAARAAEDARWRAAALEGRLRWSAEWPPAEQPEG